MAVFFFLSGYGLRISHDTKECHYVNAIPKKRMLPLYLQCIVLIALYVVLYFIISKEVNIIIVLQSFFWGGTMIANGWYLQVILVLYGFYYIIYGLISRKKQNKISLHIMMFLSLIICALICILLGKIITWYQSIFAFMRGIIWYDHKGWGDKALSRHWIRSVITAFIAFAILFITGLKIEYFTILSALVLLFFAYDNSCEFRCDTLAQRILF